MRTPIQEITGTTVTSHKSRPVKHNLLFRLPPKIYFILGVFFMGNHSRLNSPEKVDKNPDLSNFLLTFSEQTDIIILKWSYGGD